MGLTHFLRKAVNDNLGHDTGDELLKQVAYCLESTIRESDIAARIGGDEFAILIKKLHQGADAELVADKILSRLSTPIPGITERYPIGVSIGILLIPEDADEINQILKKADQAMYHAKNSGKNRYFLYRDPPA